MENNGLVGKWYRDRGMESRDRQLKEFKEAMNKESGWIEFSVSLPSDGSHIEDEGLRKKYVEWRKLLKREKVKMKIREVWNDIVDGICLWLYGIGIFGDWELMRRPVIKCSLKWEYAVVESDPWQFAHDIYNAQEAIPKHREPDFKWRMHRWRS